MLLKRDGIYYQSSLLAGLHGVIHGFSGRRAGDMRQGKSNRERLLRTIGFSQIPSFARQTHGNMVPGDGLVSRTNPVDVFIADCVPVLFVDPQSHVCCAVHAGWKGTLGEIVKNALNAMIREGARVEGIHVAIGPHIGACCYDVPEERAKAFIARFGSDGKMTFKIEGKWHLDIGWVNYRQLLAAGITADHIDAPPTCTSCQNHEFFSHRKDSKETYGEMMAVIGFK